jgi:hypothetical protein
LPPLHELQATLDMSQAGAALQAGGETLALPGVGTDTRSGGEIVVTDVALEEGAQLAMSEVADKVENAVENAAEHAAEETAEDKIIDKSEENPSEPRHD